MSIESPARSGWGRLGDSPNPIWIRELKQSARLTRTPWILTTLTILMTLLIATIGGVMSSEAAPATTGVVLFQVYFSIAFFVVSLIGPAVAANSIASEREGRTWEAVLLTGLSPGVVCRGKFLAAFTSIGMYIVMLAPVGAVPFLFGGVTATETVVAFAFLFLIALLSVAFGLAVSSKMSSVRAAIVVTLLLAFPVSLAAFLAFGPGLSVVAHRLWPGVPEGPPIWLPVAYERAPFDFSYMAFLLLVPVVVTVLPAWFLYEVTVANLTSVTDDRSTGLKRWFLVATPVLTGCAALVVTSVPVTSTLAMTVAASAALFAYLSFNVFLFLGDPIGPSRRVVAQWDLAGAGRFRRFLGPGTARSSMLELLAGGGALVMLTGLGMFLTSSASGRIDATAVGAFGAYSLAFLMFMVGLGAYLRARSDTPLVARVLLLAILFGVAVVPWVIAAVAGLLSDHGGKDAVIVGAPSPFYVFVMLDAISRGGSHGQVVAGMACALGWAILGAVLLGAAWSRGNGIIKKHAELLEETDRLLAAEDDRTLAVAGAPDTPLEPAQPEGEAAAPPLAEP